MNGPQCPISLLLAWTEFLIFAGRLLYKSDTSALRRAFWLSYERDESLWRDRFLVPKCESSFYRPIENILIIQQLLLQSQEKIKKECSSMI